MNDESHRQVRESLGAYVLGQLDAQEAAEVSAHIDNCHDCQAELEQLRPVVAALGSAGRAPATPEELPLSALTKRVDAALSEEARRRRRVRTTRLGIALTSAAALVAVAVIAFATLSSPDPAPVAIEQVLIEVPDARGDVTASAGLIAHTWGVEVVLTASGFTSGEVFQVDIVGVDGTRSTAGAFVGTGEKEMVCNLNSGVLRPDATAFEVIDDDGTVVLRSEF